MLATESISPWRGWLALWRVTMRRQLRASSSLVLGLLLLAIMLLVVGLVSARFGWDRTSQRLERDDPRSAAIILGGAGSIEIEQSNRYQEFIREGRPDAVFSRWVIFLFYLGLLLPLWTLGLAVGGIGAEREGRTLIWLMSRPMPRGSIYLAKFLGVLPWCLGLSLGGLALIGLVGGEVGQAALTRYWRAACLGTMAFAALFHLIGAIFRRPAIVGLVYSFFFETILNELPVPGTLKRLSITHYTRCLMYARAEADGIPIESRALLVPLGETTSLSVLICLTIGLTALGMFLFARMEPSDDA